MQCSSTKSYVEVVSTNTPFPPIFVLVTFLFPPLPFPQTDFPPKIKMSLFVEKHRSYCTLVQFTLYQEISFKPIFDASRIHHGVPKTTSAVFNYNRKFVGTHILGFLVVAHSLDRSAFGKVIEGGVSKGFLKMNLECVTQETDFVVTVYTACAPQSIENC